MFYHYCYYYYFLNEKKEDSLKPYFNQWLSVYLETVP